MDVISFEQTAAVEVYADVRFAGQSHELSVRVHRPGRDHIAGQCLEAYRERYGEPPTKRRIEIVTLRARRIGRAAEMTLPRIATGTDSAVTCQIIERDGESKAAQAFTRSVLLATGLASGPVLIIDPEATCFVPRGWSVVAREDGSVIADREGLK